jgi:hypothetical protein
MVAIQSLQARSSAIPKMKILAFAFFLSVVIDVVKAYWLEIPMAGIEIELACLLAIICHLNQRG